MFELTNKLFVVGRIWGMLRETQEEFSPLNYAQDHKNLCNKKSYWCGGQRANAICTPSQRFGSLNTCFQFVEFVCRGNLNLNRMSYPQQPKRYNFTKKVNTYH